jgi:hypothetical protein
MINTILNFFKVAVKHIIFNVFKIAQFTSLLLAKFLNFVIQPNRQNGEVILLKKLVIGIVLFNLIFIQSTINLPDKIAIYIYFALLLTSILFFTGVFFKISEEMDIYQGFLVPERRKFTRIDAVFSKFMMSIFFLLLFFSLLMFLINLGHILGGVFVSENSLEKWKEFVVWIYFIVKAVIPIIVIEHLDNLLINMGVVNFSFTETGQYLNFAIRILLSWIIIKVIIQYISKLFFDKKLLESLTNENGDANIELIQRKMALLSDSFKKHLLDFAINGDSDIIKRRAINVLYYSNTIAFPQTFLYNLHHQSRDIQRIGLNRIKSLLENNNLHWERKTLVGIGQKAYFQRRKQTNDRNRELLTEIINLTKNL